VIRLSVLYPATEGARFDHDYYRDVHVPLAVRTWEPVSSEIDRGVDGPYLAAVHLCFADMAALQEAMGREGTRAVRDDVPNYTDVAPVRQVSEVTSGRPEDRLPPHP